MNLVGYGANNTGWTITTSPGDILVLIHYGTDGNAWNVSNCTAILSYYAEGGMTGYVGRCTSTGCYINTAGTGANRWNHWYLFRNQ